MGQHHNAAYSLNITKGFILNEQRTAYILSVKKTTKSCYPAKRQQIQGQEIYTFVAPRPDIQKSLTKTSCFTLHASNGYPGTE